MTGRRKDEWQGKTPDSRPPPHVRLRIFRTHGGRCHITGQKIRPGDAWECDHIKPLEDGGENREFNMAPALYQPHRQKTAEENSRRAKADRVAAKHLGLKKPGRGWGNPNLKRKVNGTVVPR